MNLRSLEFFLTVAEENSISRAAELAGDVYLGAGETESFTDLAERIFMPRISSPTCVHADCPLCFPSIPFIKTPWSRERAWRFDPAFGSGQCPPARARNQTAPGFPAAARRAGTWG